MNSLKTVVVGAGHMGRLHATKLAAVPGVEIAAIADIDRSRADALAGQMHARAFTDWRQAIEGAQAVVIAVPTAQHADVLRACLANGIHVLVEKPITGTLEDAGEAIALAKAHGAVLQVAHVERFNAAFRAMAARIERPLFIDTERLAGFQQRAANVDVVLDLMIHDLDLMLALVGADVTSVSACGFGVLTQGIDIANAYIEFGNGCVANLSASRVSQSPVRKLRVFQHNLYASADLQVGRLRYVVQSPEGRIEQIDENHAGGDALAVQDQAFVAAVRGERPVAVTGEDGRRALELGLTVGKLVHDRLARFAETLA
jgi:predicted dehydrogenase